MPRLTWFVSLTRARGARRRQIEPLAPPAGRRRRLPFSKLRCSGRRRWQRSGGDVRSAAALERKPSYGVASKTARSQQHGHTGSLASLAQRFGFERSAEYAQVNLVCQPYARARRAPPADRAAPPAGRRRRLPFSKLRCSGRRRWQRSGGDVRSAAALERKPSYGVASKTARSQQHGHTGSLASLAQRFGFERSAEYAQVNLKGLKRLPVTAIPVPEQARPSGGLRLRKLFSRR